jgi:NAD(P)-dependent dehydrogenase (short-subunit alcohol dehydrogenase family)
VKNRPREIPDPESRTPDPVAFVSGGAVRVGRAISLALAGAGYRVVVHYGSSEGEARALVEEIREGGGDAVAVQADLSDHDAVLRLADEALGAFGGLDLLVNNAASFAEEGLDEVDGALWESVMAVNLRAPFFLTQRIGGAMREAGGGAVVNIADLSGIQAWRGYAAHGIAKAGLVQLTKVAARSLAPEVRVNAVVPGTVLPPPGTPEEEVRRLAERAPLERIGSPEDVAGAVLYLARAEFVTGTVLTVDGGRSIAG